jgi:class 3 adenylate cyclase/Zn finger protein HypA/HybF involved in hydrogenase expression
MEFFYRWRWKVESSPGKLWELLSDTDRFNRETGLPKVEILEYGEAGRKRVRFVKFGMVVEWVEEPFEWEWTNKFSVVRNYVRGPIKRLKTETIFENGWVEYRVWAEPVNALGIIAIWVQIGLVSRYKFEQVTLKMDKLAKANQVQKSLDKPQVETQRLMGLVDEVGEFGNQLAKVIVEWDDERVVKMRAYNLADIFGKDRKQVLLACLKATRAGILNLEWDVICPMCRGVRQKSGNIAGIGDKVHCPACKVNFDVDFEKHVEVTFYPNPSIRKIVRSEYCVGGPGVTPHILAQIRLGAHEERRIGIRNYDNRNYEYRWRVIGEDTNKSLLVSDGKIVNKYDREVIVVLEKTAERKDATLAFEIFAMQEFRDLFSDQALRANQKISVGRMAIVFTDLRGSTKMYREIGDAVAFGYVLEHFDILKNVVAKHDGAIVKTIGDAIMAVFVDPVNAIRALLAAQKEMMKRFNDPKLKLKAGVHYGPCIAVNLNDKIDYFGTTVNLAARLEGQSDERGIVVTPDVLNDFGVKEWMKKEGWKLKMEMFEASLKGFDEETFKLARIAMVK